MIAQAETETGRRLQRLASCSKSHKNRETWERCSFECCRMKQKGWNLRSEAG